MKKTISINISSTPFFIDEDAYQELKKYLKKLEDWFKGKDGGREVIDDIELRLSELFRDRINPKTEVITLVMVKEVIEIMGQPEEFIPDDSESFYSKDSQDEPVDEGYKYKRPKKFYRDMDNKVFGGICSGLAAYLNIDPVIIRILYILLSVGSFGLMLVIYIVLWLVVPVAVTPAQKLEMRGENVTVSSIEKTVKKQFKNAKDQVGKMKDSDSYKKGEKFINSMSKTDKTVLIIVATVVGLLLLNFMFFGNPAALHFSHFRLPTMFYFSPGIFPLLLVLLVLGLIFRSAFKGFLILILTIIALLLLFKFTGMIFSFPHYMMP